MLQIRHVGVLTKKTGCTRCKVCVTQSLTKKYVLNVIQRHVVVFTENTDCAFFISVINQLDAQKFCASSWLITEINILKCTVSKIPKQTAF